MGMTINGGMIVGRNAEDIPLDLEGDVGEAIYNLGMDWFCPHFDADRRYWVVGFPVENVELPLDISGDWYKDVLEKSQKFFKEFGVQPMLIGMQDVF